MSDRLLEQYKLCVAMADHVMQRKQYANIFFFAINSLTIPLLAIFVTYARYADGITLEQLSCPILVTTVVGTFNCLTWYYLLQYYHRLSRAKYTVVAKMEAKLGSSPYCDEQEILQQDENKHRPLATVEAFAPLVFALFYVAGSAFAIFQLSQRFWV